MKRLRIKYYGDYSWKKNPNAKYVGRPTSWGNPFTVEEFGLEYCLVLYREWLKEKLKREPDFLEPLRGKDLVCWCPLNKSCHADILIEFCERKT